MKINFIQNLDLYLLFLNKNYGFYFELTISTVNFYRFLNPCFNLTNIVFDVVPKSTVVATRFYFFKSHYDWKHEKFLRF